MKNYKLFFIGLVVALILIAAPIFSAQAIDTMPPPIDPQSWALWRDMTFDDFKPNPVIDWMTDLNPASLRKPAGVPNAGMAQKINGGVVLIDYLDRKFISRDLKGNDPLGFYMYKVKGGGMEDFITNNPILSATEFIADKKYGGDISKVTDADFAQWWADYLNVPQEMNFYTTVDSFYRETSYGRWAVDLKAYGPYTIPYFEFETMQYDMSSNFQTYRDVPPSFRRGTAASSYTNFDTVAIQWARDRSREQTGNTLFNDVDFFFLLHAGYDESGVWQQFGQFQFPNRKDIPYELGPGPRMTQVEKFFTENPDYLTTYATRYGSLANSGETAGVAAFWNGERDKYAALVAQGKGNEYVFKLRQQDWDWVNGYNDQTVRNTRYVAFTCWAAAVGEWSHMTTASAANTGVSPSRTIRYSTQGESDGRGTFAHEFGHIGDLPDNYQLQWTINNSPLTEPWEVMSAGQIAGPYGEHTRWQVPGGMQGDSVPSNMSMRNKITLSFYDTLTANLHNTVKVTSGAKSNDLLMLTVEGLASSTPVVAEVVQRNIPLNNSGLYPQLDKYGLVSPNYYKGIQLAFVNNTTSNFRDKAVQRTTGWTWTYTARAIAMGVEVVEQSGFDSYTPDHGVLISRHANENLGTNTSYTWQVIDSHLYDISLVDYMTEGKDGEPDDYVAYSLGGRPQLFDATFHAGKSFVDTGYYMTEYDPADPNYNQAQTRQLNTSNYDLVWKKGMLKPGSIQRWEPQGGRKIASGDTVNEWHDPYNDLHFYILAKNSHDGRTLPGKTKPEQFLSYTIGLLHGAGTPVNGNLVVKLAAIEAETPRKVAVANFEITNTGSATDIIRVGVEGYLSPVILNDLYAIGAGETITVPVYVELPADIRTRDVSGKEITFTASSESNSAKADSVTVPFVELIKYNYRVYLEYKDVKPIIGETFSVDLMLWGDINYAQIATELTYDPTLLELAGYDNLIGWAAAVTKPAANIVAVRSVPSMNMVIGAACDPAIRIVRLNFMVKDGFSDLSVDTKICFASAVVSPLGGVTGTGVYPTTCLPIKLYKTKAIPIDAYFEGKWQLFQPDEKLEIAAEVGGKVVLRAFYFTTEHDMYGTNVYGENNGRGGHYAPPTGDIAAYNAQGQLTGILATGNRVDFQWYIADKATNDPAEAVKLLYNHADPAQGFVVSNVHEVDTSAYYLGTKYYFIELTHTAPGNVVKKYYSAPIKVTIENSKYPAELITAAEASGWRKTTSSAELIAFYKELEKQSGGRLKMLQTGWKTFGRPDAPANATNANAHLYKPSPPQDIPMVIISDPAKPVISPADVGDRMVALINGGAHSGEVEGKEGLMLFSREAALGKWDSMLKDLVLIVLPSSNLEGNDILFAQRQSGQYLPKLVGARFSGGVLNPTIGATFDPTSESHSWYNLNRDSVKLDMPEMRVLTDIFNAWDPALYVDLHGINGMMMIHSQTWNGGLHPDTDPTLFDYNLWEFAELGLGKDSYLYQVQNKTARTYGVGWVNDANHYRSGDNCEPRYNTNYIGLRNRLAILLECYSHDPYPVRADTHYASVIGLMQALQKDKAKIEKLFADTDAWARERATRGLDKEDRRDQVTIRAGLPTFSSPEYIADNTIIREMDLEAYRTNEVTGAILSQAINDPNVRSLGITSAAGDRVGTLLAGLPAKLYKANDRRYYIPVADGDMPGRVPLGAFYLFDKDATGVAEILTLHGIEFTRFAEDFSVDAKYFQWFNVTISRAMQTYYEGRLLATNPGGQTAGAASAWVGNWTQVTQPQIIPAGTYIVSTAQPLGNLVGLLLEPGCVDGLMNWGFSAAVQNPIQIKFFDDCYDKKAGTIRYNFKSNAGEIYVPIFKLTSYEAIPLEKPITATGIDASCELGITQKGVWKHALSPATVGVPNAFMVANNGIAYEVHLTKPGFYPIIRTGADEFSFIYAGNTIHFGKPYFYKIKVPVGVSEVLITSNGTIVENGIAGQEIELLCDFLGTMRTAELNFKYGGITHKVEFLLDGTDPFEIIKSGVIAVPFAKVEQFQGNTNRLTITVTEFFPDGTKHEITATITINNNEKGTYQVGPCPGCQRTYSVYVDTKGNDQIRECRIVQYSPVEDDDDIK